MHRGTRFVLFALLATKDGHARICGHYDAAGSVDCNYKRHGSDLNPNTSSESLPTATVFTPYIILVGLRLGRRLVT